MAETNTQARDRLTEGDKASRPEQQIHKGDDGIKDAVGTASSAASLDRVVAEATRQSKRIASELQSPAGASPTLTRTLKDTFLDERDDVLSVINELEDQLDRHEEIRQSLEHDLTRRSEQLQLANQRVQELEWQVVGLQTRVDALEHVRQELGLLEEQLGDANGRVQRLSEECKRTEKENARLDSELKAVNKQFGELWIVRKERDGLRADLRNLRAKLDQVEQSNRELAEERTQLQLRLHETLATLDQIRNAQHRLGRELRTANDRNHELQRVQETAEEKLEQLRTEKKSLQAQVAHLERQGTRLADQQQFYEGELSSLRNINRSAETALSNVKKAFADVRLALSETKSRVRRRTMENWPRINAGLRGVANAASDAPLGTSGDNERSAATIGEPELATAGLAADERPAPEDHLDIQEPGAGPV
jgi:chromosome segregation ATPase